jgi:hypothetical protein
MGKQQLASHQSVLKNAEVRLGLKRRLGWKYLLQPGDSSEKQGTNTMT